MAAVGLGLIYRFPLRNPAIPMKIEAGDVISFLLIAVGFGCVAIAAITGRLQSCAHLHARHFSWSWFSHMPYSL